MLVKHRQDGFALIEAMVAIVIMALGILGILGVQMRSLADTQTSVRRAQAIRAIEDLSERMKVNPSALTNIDSYAIGWGSTTSPTDCAANACDAKTLAQSDVQQWRESVQKSLPLADANVFVTPDETLTGNRRQLGVMVSWRENEREDGTATENAEYKDPIGVSSGGANVSCPTDRTCHLQYIQLTSRCTMYSMAGAATSQFFCPP